jgi:hypothetical protein
MWSSIEELREVLAQMVADGDLVSVPEIDPVTGKWRNRYFHPKRAPKIN